MSLLVDHQIATLAKSSELISPFYENHLSAVTYDLSVDSVFMLPRKSKVIYRDSNGEIVKTMSFPANTNFHIPESETFQVLLELKPGEVVLCQSKEAVKIPNFLTARLSVRSSFARKWLNHSDADMILPGFSGNITFELKNDGPDVFELEIGCRPIQISFHKLDGIPTRAYAGRYQNQSRQLESL